MSGPWLMAVRYLVFHRAKSLIMILGLAVTFFLPVSTRMLIRSFEKVLSTRARATPLVVGRRGGEYGLVLNTLYFSTESPVSVTQGDADKLREMGLATVIPIYTEHIARGFKVVATTLDYFEFRGLQPLEGTWPVALGDAVLGADAAEGLQLDPGGSIVSDHRNLYNIAESFPLKLRVVGVLKRTGTPDDRAIFVDLKTAWVMDGIGHGHDDLTQVAEPNVLQRKGDNIVFAPSLKLYNEVTPENIHTFHFAGDPASYPLSAIIVVPHDDRSRTILLGRYVEDERLQMVQPSRVMGDLMALILQVERVFNGYFALVVVSTVLFFGLVVALSLRLRRREMQTLYRLGCSRGTMVQLVVIEIGVVVIAALLMSSILSVALVRTVVAMKLI